MKEIIQIIIFYVVYATILYWCYKHGEVSTYENF